MPRWDYFGGCYFLFIVMSDVRGLVGTLRCVSCRRGFELLPPLARLRLYLQVPGGDACMQGRRNEEQLRAEGLTSREPLLYRTYAVLMILAFL